MRAFSVTAIVIILTTQAAAHSGGLNKQGCHAGSQPYHCHKRAQVEPLDSSNSTILNGTVTHVRDGDTIEVNGIAVRLSALDCPENDTQQGRQATKIAKQFEGSQAMCELTGAKSYDHLNVHLLPLVPPNIYDYLRHLRLFKGRPIYNVRSIHGLCI